MSIHTVITTAAFGALQLTAVEAGLTGLHFAGQRYFVDPPAGSRPDPSAAIFRAAAEQLAAYAAGELRTFDLPLALTASPNHSPGRLAVWEALRAVPWGETTTYGGLAAQLGRPGMAQAVGQGVGHNPVSIVVPCHRVIGADGSLTGYAGGLARKRQLLELEGVLQPQLL